MFLSEQERRARWAAEGTRAAVLSQQANIHFAHVVVDWSFLHADPAFVALLAGHGLNGLWLGRSARASRTGRHEGVSVLELAVLSGMLSSLLSHADIVRWMATHQPRMLTRWQAAADAAAPRA